MARAIGRDLSAATGAPVEVALTLPAEFATLPHAELAGESTRRRALRRRRCACPLPGVLGAGGPVIAETLTTRLFRSVCPVTGQPDFASVQIRLPGPRDRSRGPAALPRLVPPSSRLPRALRRADLRRPPAPLPAAALDRPTRASPAAAASTSIHGAPATTARRRRTDAPRGNDRPRACRRHRGSARRGDHFFRRPVRGPDARRAAPRDATRCSSCAHGRIVAFGPAADWLPTLPPTVPVTRYDNALIVPGFIDAHVHYPQLAGHRRVRQDAARLARRTTPSSSSSASPIPASPRPTAEALPRRVPAPGRPRAAVYGTVHAASVDGLLRRALRPRPADDRRQGADGPQRPGGAARHRAVRATTTRKALIARWHGRGRLALRGDAALRADVDAGAARRRRRACCAEHPGVYLQTHLAENARRDRVGRAAVSRRARLPRRLRPPRPGRPAQRLRPRHPPARGRAGSGCSKPAPRSRTARRRTTSSAAATSASRDAQARRRGRCASRSPPTSAAARRCRCCATMNEAYKVARHAGFALVPAQSLWLVTAWRGAGARPRRRRSARSPRQRRRHRGARPRRDAAPVAAGCRSASRCDERARGADDAGRRPRGRGDSTPAAGWSTRRSKERGRHPPARPVE